MKIGILGGIGPEASALFYTKLVKGLKSSGKIKSNKDFPEIIINNINAKELVDDNINNKDLEPYLKGINDLKIYNPDFIVMVCNTIHIYRDYLIDNSNYKNILSIRDIAFNKLKNNTENITILGTFSTVNSGLYNFSGLNYINLNKENLIKIGDIVFKYNKNGNLRESISQLNSVIYNDSVSENTLYLSACTEISNILLNSNGIKYIDTLDLLLDFTLNKILREIK